MHYLTVAGGYELSTFDQFMAHLKKAKNEDTLDVMVEGILKRNNALTLWTEAPAVIASIERNQYFRAVGVFLTAVRARRKELKAAQAAYAFGHKVRVA